MIAISKMFRNVPAMAIAVLLSNATSAAPVNEKPSAQLRFLSAGNYFLKDAPTGFKDTTPCDVIAKNSIMIYVQPADINVADSLTDISIPGNPLSTSSSFEARDSLNYCTPPICQSMEVSTASCNRAITKTPVI